MAQRVFIGIGVVLLCLGAIVLGVTVFGSLQTEPERAEPNTPAAVVEVQRHQPSRAWSIVGGLSLAAGAGLIGIGMNRWRGLPPPRATT